MTILLFLLVAFDALGDLPRGPTTTNRAVIETGKLQSSAIREASGMARSNTRSDLLWVLNDGGSPATLHAVGLDGADLGRVLLTKILNIDWEDLATFEHDDRSWLLIADVGDNFAMRRHVTLYVVEEPDAAAKTAKAAWQVSFHYPDGPRDAEAVAVDANEGHAYILSKRTIPAELYTVSLRPDDTGLESVRMAEYLGPVASIPQPTADDLERAVREQNWHWQPTGMDFSPDGRTAAILTYKAVYLYRRDDDQAWIDALQQTPEVFDLGDIKDAEAISLVDKTIFVTVEALHAPLYRIHFK